MKSAPILNYGKPIDKREISNKRFAAAILDAMVVSPVVVVPSVGLLPGPQYGFVTVVLFFLACVYLGSEAAFGRTLGKYILGLQVVPTIKNSDGVCKSTLVSSNRFKHSERLRLVLRCAVKNLYLIAVLSAIVLKEITRGGSERDELVVALQNIVIIVFSVGVGISGQWLYQVARGRSPTIADMIARTEVRFR
jgi:hypothetical protein